jgi:hypothetical protein
MALGIQASKSHEKFTANLHCRQEFDLIDEPYGK